MPPVAPVSCGCITCDDGVVIRYKEFVAESPPTMLCFVLFSQQATDGRNGIRRPASVAVEVEVIRQPR